MTDIHDLLHDNTPGEPPTGGWADAVRGKRRRRRVLTGAAAGVLAVGLAVPIGVSLLNRPTQVAQPADTTPVTLPARTADEVCTTAKAQMTKLREKMDYATNGKPILEKGAARAWLCGDDSADVTFGTRGLFDPLTADVDKAVAWFLDAKRSDPMQACTAEYRMTYTVAFEYADGTIAPVQGELHGCRSVTDGSRTVNGGEEFLDLLTGLWTTHRAPDVSAEAKPCTTNGSVITAKPEEATTGGVCVIGNSGTLGMAELGDAAALGKAIAEGSVETDGLNLDYGFQTIYLDLIDKAGDMIRLERLADGRYLSYAHDGQATVWTPSAEESAILDAAIKSATP
ncbi:MAG: hypothetical protein QM713_11275 [Arachnia sp.]